VRLAKTVACAIATAAALTAAPPASANRAYGAFDPVEQLLTFEVSDSGRQIRAATGRLWLECDQDYSFQTTSTFTIVPRGAKASARNRFLLIAGRARHGELRYRLLAVWGTRRRHTTYTGFLRISRLADRSAHVQLMVRSVSSLDRTDRCAGQISRGARREPGVLFVGATDDDEPVWVRRDGDRVEWLNGCGAPCRGSDEFMEGIHADWIAMTSATTFGWPALIDGFSIGSDEALVSQSVQVAGTLDSNTATGTLQIVGRPIGSGARCDTGVRHWRAVSS
jgi:hypothetical protein